MNKKEKRNHLKTETLLKQDGKCAWCLRDETCSASFIDPDHDHSKCKIQKIFTFDHNHSHIGCNGCEQCIRGIVHNNCNRWIGGIERSPHLHNEFIKQYLAKGQM